MGVPHKTMGSYLDPGLLGTGLQGGGVDAGPGPPSLKEKGQLEPGRDGTVARDL
jgi:hypothetical protein